jgi:uncharacterized membrane protein required for colicin V production
MIAAVTESHPAFSLDHLPFNWFDLALIAVLLFGLYRGRKNGMSKEFLPLLEWLLAVVLATLFYSKLTDILVNVANMKRSAGTYVVGYLMLVMLVFLVFYFIKYSLKPKVGGSSVFGGGEYYLGMLGGMLRYACIVTLFLALLNAPIYSTGDVAAIKAYNKKNYGGGLYEGNYLPNIPSVQHSVFEESFLGHYIKDYCGVILIHSDDSSPIKTPKKMIAAGTH